MGLGSQRTQETVFSEVPNDMILHMLAVALCFSVSQPRFRTSLAIIYTVHIIMSNNCIQQDCSLNCCDADGYCPSNVRDCRFSYSSSAGVTAAIVIGSVFLVVCIVVVIYLIISRCRGRREGEQN